METKALHNAQADRFRAFCRTLDADAYADACRAALQVNPDDIDARLGLAQAVGHGGDWDAKLEMLHQMVAEFPGADRPNVTLGIELMSRGRYREGWKYYNHRKRRDAKSLIRRGMPPEREWRGEPLPGKTILIHREQGLGDTLHFVRNAIALQRIGALPVLDVQGPMRQLLRQSPALGRVLHADDKATPHYWIRMMDLVPALTPTLQDVTWPGAYVAAPADGWLYRPISKSDGLRVGLAWGGNPEFPMNALRSVPLQALTPLADTPGCTFYSLMPDTVADDVRQQTRWMTDLSPVSTPFDRLAAVIGQMDVVVTICTSIAHLAAAMGKPTFLMLSFVAEWRWTRRGETTPWYPSMRLFRQRRLGDWDPVVHDVMRALAAL